jgi:hypothetical protein
MSAGDEWDDENEHQTRSFGAIAKNETIQLSPCRERSPHRKQCRDISCVWPVCRLADPDFMRTCLGETHPDFQFAQEKRRKVRRQATLGYSNLL